MVSKFTDAALKIASVAFFPLYRLHDRTHFAPGSYVFKQKMKTLFIFFVGHCDVILLGFCVF